MTQTPGIIPLLVHENKQAATAFWRRPLALIACPWEEAPGKKNKVEKLRRRCKVTADAATRSFQFGMMPTGGEGEVARGTAVM